MASQLRGVGVMRVYDYFSRRKAGPIVLILSFSAQSCAMISGLSTGSGNLVSTHSLPAAEDETKKRAPVEVTRVHKGAASWYGPRFHGKKTASGETFDQSALTAAHRTFPLGSRARVTNLDNNKSVEVEINDRGPFMDGRIIDLSQAAAKALGMTQDGTANVRVELLSEPGKEAEEKIKQ